MDLDPVTANKGDRKVKNNPRIRIKSHPDFATDAVGLGLRKQVVGPKRRLTGLLYFQIRCDDKR